MPSGGPRARPVAHLCGIVCLCSKIGPDVQYTLRHTRVSDEAGERGPKVKMHLGRPVSENQTVHAVRARRSIGITALPLHFAFCNR